MRFDIITLFPELIEPYLRTGVTRRAFQSQNQIPPLIEIRLWQLRNYATDNYKRVDDRPFGGGPGMVMLAEPLFTCLAAIHESRQAQLQPASQPTYPIVLFAPTGQTLNQSVIQTWASPKINEAQGGVLICGRYEGIDQRFIDRCVTHQLSLGDFVLSGGEIAAVAFLDAIARLQPGVLMDEQSHRQDSFNADIDGLLDCPHFTRPEIWRGASVPDILLSGHHANIQTWRHNQRRALTEKLRPDILAPAHKPG